MNSWVVQAVATVLFWGWIIGMLVVGTRMRRRAGYVGINSMNDLPLRVMLSFFGLVSAWPFTRAMRDQWIGTNSKVADDLRGLDSQ